MDLKKLAEQLGPHYSGFALVDGYDENNNEVQYVTFLFHAVKYASFRADANSSVNDIRDQIRMGTLYSEPIKGLLAGHFASMSDILGYASRLPPEHNEVLLKMCNDLFAKHKRYPDGPPPTRKNAQDSEVAT